MIRTQVRRSLFGWLAISLALFTMLGVSPTGAQDEETAQPGVRPDAPAYGVRGSYAVGFMTFAWEEDGIPVEGGIWYPALNPEGVEEHTLYQLVDSNDFPAAINYFEGRAINNAEPDTAHGPYPLIISSTGYGGTPFHLAPQHEHFASYGFVVVAVHHKGNGMRDSIKVQTEEQYTDFVLDSIDSMVNRPIEISQGIDYAEMLTQGDGAFAGTIDLDHVGVYGISYGGYTAVMSAGGWLDFDEMAAYCEDIAGSDVINDVCKFYGDDLSSLEAHWLEMTGINAEPGTIWTTFGDARVDTIIVMSPGSTAFIAQQSLAAIDIPTMIMYGTLDDIQLIDHSATKVWDNISSSTKALVAVENGTHTFFLKCGPGLREAYFDMCVGPVWDKDRIFDMSNHLATAFLLAELYGDAEATAALAPDAVQFPGIQYEATGF